MYVIIIFSLSGYKVKESLYTYSYLYDLIKKKYRKKVNNFKFKQVYKVPYS